MKKLLLCIAFVGTFPCVASLPLRITNLTITPIVCPGGVTGSIEVTAVGGSPSEEGYFFQINQEPAVQAVSTHTFLNVGDGGSKDIKVSDALGENDLIALNSMSSPFSSIVFTQTLQCSGTTVTYAVETPPGSATTVQEAILVGPDGVPQTLTGLTGEFPDLQEGNYTLTLVPADAATVACDVSTILKFQIKQSSLQITNVAATALSQGGTAGILEVDVSGGTGPFLFERIGPLPSAIVVLGTLDPADPRAAAFSNVPGGFFTVRVTEIFSGCSVTQLVAVNFFANAVANRIALAYC